MKGKKKFLTHTIICVIICVKGDVHNGYEFSIG